MNLFQRFEQTASRQPDRLALQIKEGETYRRLTYGEVARQVGALAGALVEAGLSAGERVALLSENRPEWVVAYLAVTAAGAAVVPLDVQLPDAEIANVLGHAECRRGIASGKQAPRLLAMTGRGAGLAAVVDLDAPAHDGPRLSFTALLAGGSGALPSLPPVREDDLASILYTSGTTGTPKGVMLSHGNFLGNAESILAFRLVRTEDNWLALLPFHHAFPFMVQLIVLFTGATVTFPPSLKSPDLFACMHETGVTLLVGVPQLFYLLHKGIFDQIGRRPLAVRLLLGLLLRLSGALRPAGINLGRAVFGQVHRRFGGRIRILASGGARLDPAIARDFLALGFTLIEGYGLTETAPVVTFNPLDRMRPGSVGIPLPGVEVRIVNPDAEGVGEIAVRGPNVMRGYYRMPEATAEAVRDGWFHTGDLGRREPDGYVVITGRAKEVIVLSSGKNIYPEEIEEQYQKSRYIKEICLVPQVSARGGAELEGLLALVLPDFDVFRAEGITNIFETVRWDMENMGKGLPAWKRPTGLSLVKEGFPRTRLGKIRRHLMQGRYRAENAGGQREETRGAEAPAEPEDEVAAQVLAYLRETAQKPAVRLDDSLELDLGLDSLARIEMLVALESLVGVKVPDEAAECFTVREVVECMRRARAGGGGPTGAPMGLIARLGEVPPEAVEVLATSATAVSRASTAFTSGVSVATFRTLYRLRVVGRERVPVSGPLILVANHVSYFDAFILVAAMPRQAIANLFALSLEQFFRGRLLSWWGRQIHIIPVDMDTHLIRALQTSAHVLRSGKILIVFPEGERSADGGVCRFRKGTGILVRELNVPVLPAYIAGAYEAWPRGQTWPRLSRIRVRFGEVVQPQELLHGDGPRGADEAETIVLRLRQRVAALGENPEAQP
ncbi:MAG: AMP-binding protein [Candidatus Methylomirabilota bacterium]